MWTSIMVAAGVVLGGLAVWRLVAMRKTAASTRHYAGMTVSGHPIAPLARLTPSPEWNAYLAACDRFQCRPTRELRAMYCATFHAEETFLLRRDLAEALAQHEAWGHPEPSTAPMLPLPFGMSR